MMLMFRLVVTRKILFCVDYIIMPVYIIIDNLKNYPPIRQTNTHTQL